MVIKLIIKKNTRIALFINKITSVGFSSGVNSIYKFKSQLSICYIVWSLYDNQLIYGNSSGICLAHSKNSNTVLTRVRSVNCPQQWQQVLLEMTYLNASFMRQAKLNEEVIFIAGSLWNFQFRWNFKRFNYSSVLRPI